MGANHMAYPGQSSSEAYFVVAFEGTAHGFVIKLTDGENIRHARRLATGEETSRPSVNGIIIKEPAPYNPGWSYHLDPRSIEFFDVAAEVCDANACQIEQMLDAIGGDFLPGNRWCPWGSRIIKEIGFAACVQDNY
jgi:hypothetical protein